MIEATKAPQKPAKRITLINQLLIEKFIHDRPLARGLKRLTAAPFSGGARGPE